MKGDKSGKRYLQGRKRMRKKNKKNKQKNKKNKEATGNPGKKKSRPRASDATKRTHGVRW